MHYTFTVSVRTEDEAGAQILRDAIESALQAACNTFEIAATYGMDAVVKERVAAQQPATFIPYSNK